MTENTKKSLSKKAKIIIAIVCVALVIIGIVTAIILVNIKRFDMTPNLNSDYNDHTQFIAVGSDIGSKYSKVDANYYNNGVQIVKDNNQKHGLFSYISNSLVLDTNYQISVIKDNTEDNQTLFKAYTFGKTNCLNIVNQNGTILDITETDIALNSTFAYIKSKSVELTEKNDKIKTNISRDFKTMRVAISDIEYVTTFHKDGKYTYEVWNITTTGNITYKNLYKVNGESRELIQTINNSIGSNINCGDMQIRILTDGTPVLISINMDIFDNSIANSELVVYDINFNKKGSTPIDLKTSQYLYASLEVGDNFYFQCVTPATESKYDIADTTFGIEFSYDENIYHNLTTYKVSLKTGKVSEVDFDYLIQGVEDSFNSETALLNTYKIESKKLTSQQILLVNEKLQTKKLNYSFNTIQKITNDRYLASTNGTYNFYLIDGGYNLICKLDNASSVFTTSDTIVYETSDMYSYVCNLDGVVLKQVTTNSIQNVNDDKYYVRVIEKEVNGVNQTEYYLERQGKMQETPFHINISETSEYTYNDQNYVDFSLIHTDNYTLIVRTRKSGATTYTYDFYTIDGKLLNSVSNVSTNYQTVTLIKSYDNNVLINFYGTVYLLDR